MSTFRVGQKVVCVKTHSRGFVVAGNQYTITGVFDLCGCEEYVTVGVAGYYDDGSRYKIGWRAHCSRCKIPWRTPTMEKLISSTLFRPLIEDLTAELARKEAERIVIERPDLINEPEPI